MSEIIKSKPNQKYDWSQDEKTIKVRIPIKGTSLKKIDIFISDYILKVNVTEKKFVKILDLKKQIDFQCKENQSVYFDEVLECTLIKKDIGMWNELLETELSKQELSDRRADSIKLKEEHEKNFQQNLNDLKIKYDRLSITEQMRQENQERENLESKKKDAKDKAENEMFNELSQIDKDMKEDRTNIVTTQESVVQEYIRRQMNPYDDDNIIQIRENSIHQKKNVSKQHQESIFDDEYFEKEEQEQQKVLPPVRNLQKQDIQFSEKPYPQLAAREQHYKDAPLPKIRQTSKDPNQLVKWILIQFCQSEDFAIFMLIHFRLIAFIHVQKYQ